MARFSARSHLCFFISLHLTFSTSDDWCGYVSSTYFKSVYCASEPLSVNLKTTVDDANQQTSGYCSKSNPDLFNFSSNQNLCSDGAITNICKKYEWNIKTSHTGTYTWDQGSTPPGMVDFETGVLYVDGELKVEGVRDDFYTFNVSLNGEGHHTVQLYVWEPCCDGLNFGGFDVINP